MTNMWSVLFSVIDVTLFLNEIFVTGKSDLEIKITIKII